MTLPQNPESFGTWVKSRRKRLDLTQAELGKRAGCSAAAIRKIEADERKPSRELAVSLSRVLEIHEAERESFLQMARGVLPDGFAPAPLETRSPPANNLPTQLTSAIQRVADLTAAMALMRDKSVRLVTVIGPPGIGKTHFSIQTGMNLLQDYPEGVWFVDLAEMEEAAFFPATVSRSLEFLDLPPTPELSQLIARLKGRRLMLVLDNFEHIVEQAALQVAEILKKCPELKILVTSRVPLHITGEQEYPLPPLNIPPGDREKDPASLMEFEAVQLLVARIRQYQPRFCITSDNAYPVMEVCRILDGIPLALELAAASLRRMTLEELVSLLKGFHNESWVRQIGTPARDLPQRQRTLENVVAWSFSLLTSEQQDLFCKLGVFAGWFDDEAVAAICFDPPGPARAKVHDLLGELSDHSLLVRDFANGIPCWRMLELIHEYASLKLDVDVHNSLRLLFTQYYLEKLKVVNQYPEHKQQESFYHFNVSNLHSALKWAIAEKDTELGFSLASEMNDLWMSHGYSKEGIELLKQLFALPDASLPEVREHHLEDAADLAWHKHDFESSLFFMNESAELARKYGLRKEYLWVLNRQGRYFIEQERFSEAREVLEESLKLAEANPELMNPGVPLAQLGEVTFFENHFDDAKGILKNALTHLALGNDSDDIFISIARVDLAEIAMAARDFEQAHEYLKLSLESVNINLRRTLTFLVAVAGYLILATAKDKENLETAARLLGAVEGLSERSEIVLGSYYQKTISSRLGLIRKRLSTEASNIAFQDGKNLHEKDAIAIARTALITPNKT